MQANFFIIVALSLMSLGLLVAVVVMAVLLARRSQGPDITAQLEQSARLGQQATEQVGSQLNQRFGEQADSFAARLAEQTRAVNERLDSQSKALTERVTEQTRVTNERLEQQSQSLNASLAQNRTELSSELAKIRETIEARLAAIQQENAAKLDEMRATVDEKLSETLDKRFSESFTLISERLESVQKGLGEMQALAGNVTDLKNILANVKTRGNFGEYQLQALLEDVFTPDQYEANFAPRPRSQARVEFAVRLPGKDEPVYMPIDSKFPIEDYQRLLEAYETGDKNLIDQAHSQLVSRAKVFARDIRDKYINPPRTTDFAVMFVPTEGLYAELLRRPGFADELRELKVLLAGPSTLQAVIVSYQIGFSTLAIERRTSEVEQLLGAVKTEFDKFQGLLDKVDKRLEQARKDISDATRKTGTIRRKLKDVSELPAAESARLLADGDDAEPAEAEVIEIEDVYDNIDPADE